MYSILFHITSGPNNISKSMLGFLLARTAAEEGHKVEIFLSGDGVQLVRDTIIENYEITIENIKKVKKIVWYRK